MRLEKNASALRAERNPTSRFPGLARNNRVRNAVGTLRQVRLIHSSPDAAVATETFRSEADVRWSQSPALRSHPHMPSTQTVVRCTCGLSVVVAVGSKLREEESENSGTSRANRPSAKMRALHIEDRWESALPPRRPRVFQSTYTWARLEPEIGQSNSRAAIIAPRSMQWEALFHRLTENSYKGPAPVGIFGKGFRRQIP